MGHILKTMHYGNSFGEKYAYTGPKIYYFAVIFLLNKINILLLTSSVLSIKSEMLIISFTRKLPYAFSEQHFRNNLFIVQNILKTFRRTLNTKTFT